MINKEALVTDVRNHPHLIHHLCWSALFGGALVGLGLSFLLQLYSTAISLSAYSSTPQGASVIAVGGFIGLIIGVIATMIAAGFVSGYLGRFHFHHHSGGIIYGFITWSLVIFLSAIMIGPMAHYLSSYGNSLTNAVVIENVSLTDNNTAVSDNATVHQHKKVTQENVAVSADKLAWGGWIMFILFFIGAISSCVGACCGMHCKRQCELH